MNYEHRLNVYTVYVHYIQKVKNYLPFMRYINIYKGADMANRQHTLQRVWAFKGFS